MSQLSKESIAAALAVGFIFFVLPFALICGLPDLWKRLGPWCKRQLDECNREPKEWRRE